jgi:hypothetical protein
VFLFTVMPCSCFMNNWHLVNRAWCAERDSNRRYYTSQTKMRHIATIELMCATCSTKFLRPMRVHRIDIAAGQTRSFCSKKCVGFAKITPHPCLHCEEITENPKYCSKSCSATANNSFIPKRVKTKKCVDCESLIDKKRTRCSSCKSLHDKANQYDDRTLGSLRDTSGSRNAYHTTIRSNSRRKAKAAGMLETCFICSYSRRIQACHLRPISTFPPTATIREVNDLGNLIGLCIRHHQELDDGLLKLPLAA